MLTNALPFRLVNGTMLDVVPPLPMTLTPASDTYSPSGRNHFGGADEWTVGEDDNVARSSMWRLSGAHAPQEYVLKM
eukprot:CAMPEP_0202826572 /NCGR_PEP_ID=MMETSP1389-20130828/13699_1 /ASSEMBLY_ACC=CAM_ASM_000865 /TAXON_ID=302021 /ORGANISM="Rhodomonas sp., Strain CCMP768" /LENGTH=76 /DNA_ID=CAMNT_0049499881 /DNA_START=35 /DNA_END=265 /DNA_ORIENTATION=-